jgi:cephalosporin hydroxylase
MEPGVDPIGEFSELVQKNIDGLSRDTDLRDLSLSWLTSTLKHKYSYNFVWLGRPIIQYPQDMIAMQEVVWSVKPDLIIETGIAHGGSLILHASLLALLDYCEAAEKGEVLDPGRPARRVLGIDIDIRAHNRAAIEAHPLASRIEMIQGSSVASDVVARVRALAQAQRRVLVCLDSNHTHEHVLAELEAYAPLVTPGSYCVVFDTVIEDLPDEAFSHRPWRQGDNAKTAVWEFLRRLSSEKRLAADGAPLAFQVDKRLEHKLLITVAPDGYLKRVG